MIFRSPFFNILFNIQHPLFNIFNISEKAALKTRVFQLSLQQEKIALSSFDSNAFFPVFLFLTPSTTTTIFFILTLLTKMEEEA